MQLYIHPGFRSYLYSSTIQHIIYGATSQSTCRQRAREVANVSLFHLWYADLPVFSGMVATANRNLLKQWCERLGKYKHAKRLYHWITDMDMWPDLGANVNLLGIHRTDAIDNFAFVISRCSRDEGFLDDQVEVVCSYGWDWQSPNLPPARLCGVSSWEREVVTQSL